ncbi:hypothetical protein G4G28_21155 [Massilia sp. Dwa41.01b]|uniref:PEP-CTERM sorting domain-containing protein n=1 Tax=unclassified Massilia TaxID=2609279 RepID=UPI00160455A8|nr:MULTISPECIES: PEP-CTERM sorting domain-containing protein [unclassified Massilia]QNA90379.1 hypothetical protein G4G28_21155 [Massilia sp. Dwa41.01b]QNA97604.1 hypothetical protein G4G31_00240 [Massilia sp. Se16.2.3]
MNRIALAAALALLVGGVAQARVIELTPEPAAASAPPRILQGSVPSRHGAQHGLQYAALLPSRLPELPEPEVFAMMLVGLVLIGYRARRESSEKFE